METKKIKISVIIPSFNTKQLLHQCLSSLDKKLELIVVDNGSTDGSQKMVESDFPQVKLIKNSKNLGYGAANNQGIKVAKGDYLLFLNSDTIVKNNAPSKMVDYLASNPQIGVLGCRLLNKDGSRQASAGWFPNLPIAFIMLFAEHWLGSLVRGSFNKIKEVDWVMGAAMMVPRKVITKEGMMDEGIFMYMDEVEWCWRIKKAGFKVIFYPGAEIVHLFGASSKSGRKDPILNIYRGLIYLYQKHQTLWQLPILKTMLKLKAALVIVLATLIGNKSLKEIYVQAFQITRS